MQSLWTWFSGVMVLAMASMVMTSGAHATRVTWTMLDDGHVAMGWSDELVPMEQDIEVLPVLSGLPDELEDRDPPGEDAPQPGMTLTEIGRAHV